MITRHLADIPLQNYLGLQQNLRNTTFPSPPGYPFPDPNFRRPRNSITSPRGTLARPKLVDHPFIIKHRVWGFEQERQVAGGDFYHKRGLQAYGKFDDCFYTLEGHGLNELQWSLGGRERSRLLEYARQSLHQRPGVRWWLKEVLMCQQPPSGGNCLSLCDI